jgi:unsaturated rhamnogalacturonyl hydrolase
VFLIILSIKYPNSEFQIPNNELRLSSYKKIWFYLFLPLKISPSPRKFQNKLKNIFLLLLFFAAQTHAQRNETKANDSNTPLHLLKPDYPVPYGKIEIEAVKNTLNRIHSYLDTVTPPNFVNSKTGETLTDLSKIDENTILQKGNFRLVSYEWGVTYGAMLLATEATGDARFKNYASKRLQFLANAAPFFKKTAATHEDWGTKTPLRNLILPRALDDCGAMCAAMIKAIRAGEKSDLRPLIDIHIDYILKKEHRLSDGTLARMRPQPNTIWLDDLFMAIPALAQMGKLTGETKYFDEATKQVLLYAKRMFNKKKGVFMHGWVEGMTEHPQFHWARANGWAIMTLVELLEVLPENHAKRPEILELLRAHARGLAAYQSGSGFWHQLLDRSDSYLETSATAIYTFALAHAINRGWIDGLAYAPMTLLGWHAVSTKINEKGQVEGTCVGTGMAFDPAFYYHRPISPFAAHGYGPSILAGAEVILLLKNKKFEINDSSLQMVNGK